MICEGENKTLLVIPPAPERPFRSLSGAEGPQGAVEESGHRRNSVRFAHSGPSQRQHRPRFAQTCCRRAPPPAPVRGWTGPSVAGSSPPSLSSRPSLCHPEHPPCHSERSEESTNQERANVPSSPLWATSSRKPLPQIRGLRNRIVHITSCNASCPAIGL